MLVNYVFNYGQYEAGAMFTVDTDKFTPEMAKTTLTFFSWNYDEDADPVDEVLKKYALAAIKIASFNNYNEHGVIREFKDLEGYSNIDGTNGIELITIDGYEFDADQFEIEKSIIS